jgi:hypothetical protein
VDPPRVLGPRHLGAVPRGDAADQALARDEDRAAVPLPDQPARRAPVRVRRLWLGTGCINCGSPRAQARAPGRTSGSGRRAG